MKLIQELNKECYRSKLEEFKFRGCKLKTGIIKFQFAINKNMYICIYEDRLTIKTIKAID